MELFNSAVDVLQTLVIALGAGLGIWALSIFWKVTDKITRQAMLNVHNDASTRTLKTT